MLASSELTISSSSNMASNPSHFKALFELIRSRKDDNTIASISTLINHATLQDRNQNAILKFHAINNREAPIECGVGINILIAAIIFNSNHEICKSICTSLSRIQTVDTQSYISDTITNNRNYFNGCNAAAIATLLQHNSAEQLLAVSSPIVSDALRPLFENNLALLQQAISARAVTVQPNDAENEIAGPPTKRLKIDATLASSEEQTTFEAPQNAVCPEEDEPSAFNVTSSHKNAEEKLCDTAQNISATNHGSANNKIIWNLVNINFINYKNFSRRINELHHLIIRTINQKLNVDFSEDIDSMHSLTWEHYADKNAQGKVFNLWLQNIASYAAFTLHKKHDNHRYKKYYHSKEYEIADEIIRNCIEHPKFYYKAPDESISLIAKEQRYTLLQHRLCELDYELSINDLLNKVKSISGGVTTQGFREFLILEDSYKHTMLSRAVQSGNIKTVRRLIDYLKEAFGKDSLEFNLQINHHSYNGTPIYISTIKNDYGIAKILLENGANPDDIVSIKGKKSSARNKKPNWFTQPKRYRDSGFKPRSELPSHSSAANIHHSSSSYPNPSSSSSTSGIYEQLQSQSNLPTNISASPSVTVPTDAYEPVTDLRKNLSPLTSIPPVYHVSEVYNELTNEFYILPTDCLNEKLKLLSPIEMLLLLIEIEKQIKSHEKTISPLALQRFNTISTYVSASIETNNELKDKPTHSFIASFYLTLADMYSKIGFEKSYEKLKDLYQSKALFNITDSMHIKIGEEFQRYNSINTQTAIRGLFSKSPTGGKRQISADEMEALIATLQHKQ